MTFEAGSRLHLYFTDGNQEPVPSAIVLQVMNLAPHLTSKDMYCLFRAFGPLAFCTIVSDEPNVEIRGSALVQFYKQDDADAAESELVRKLHILINIMHVFKSWLTRYFSLCYLEWNRVPREYTVSHIFIMKESKQR